ncbi:hypothetical protein EJ110_NYTH04743 [Nymphaea thermarum]|nr:hypothetical protein EJ110_NYTH04743 [Nymphaea thermarum]
MGFGLPAAIGVAVSNPGSIVVDINGGSSFIMNVQELASNRAYNLPVKMMACDIPMARVIRVTKVRGAIQKMLETPGPYLLDVIIMHQEHILPIIPSGGAFKDVITEGDGRFSY